MTPQAAHPWTAGAVEDRVRKHYGISATARPLQGEEDRNFHIRSTGGDYLFKISPPGFDATVLDMRIRALTHLATAAPELPLPRVQPARDGEHLITLEVPGGGTVAAHLLSWLPGTIMADARPRFSILAARLGAFLGRLDRGLADFRHPAMDRRLVWDLRRAPELEADLEVLEKDELAPRVAEILADGRERILPALADCPLQVIHNDANDYNVLVNLADPWRPEIRGLLDFGDLVRSLRVSEPAVAAAYACCGQPDPGETIAALAAGYHGENPLTESELDHLADLVRLRMAASIVVAARRSRRDPANRYHQISQAHLRQALRRLLDGGTGIPRARIRRACGLPAVASAPRVRKWLQKHRGEFAPVMDGLDGPLRVLDLSVGGRHARPSRHGEDPGWEVPRGTGLIVGRYNEARLCYTTPQFATPAGPRTVHLGMDLFAPAGSLVSAPLEGRVVCATDNRIPGDYGPTVILEHTPGGAPPFYTLYGHLGRSSLDGLQEGRIVARGEGFARLGAASENGGWPPHLHFQIITALLGHRGNYPGVASAAQREVWLEVCPDPDLILNLDRKSFPPPSLPPDDIMALRKRYLNPALSLSYRRPLTLVRGFLQYLYDHEGRAFLDGVNNVPHVGHCHPRVVEAVATQASILNTNTRYLHELLAVYARRLANTLPPPLEVCFFCNSGSEANDLALRLVRQATGRRDLVVLDAAYHGNLDGLVGISPYKFNGPGGEGRPRETHVLPLPDPYRGPFRGDPRAAARAVAALDGMLADLDAAGTPAAAFMAESLPGCGGQIELPPGFLSAAFEAVRARGGLAVADEVQVGFGRVGDAFWGFQTQGALPDVVTMGKPMGNGHPLAAVVTTRAVADAFRTGMEYFNTFGGNPVSCAAGMAVLDVIRDEKLQEHARRVGGWLKTELAALQPRYPLVGDVRGRGLYLGVELVRDRETLEPADREAAYVIERLRDEGILISVDGPLHNVLKIKPPLCFSEADARRLVETLDAVLGETFLQPA